MNPLDIKKKILIFIPAYNVEKEIFLVIQKIPKEIFNKNLIKILIVNDFSSDNTAKEIEKILEKFKYSFEVYNSKSNLGYGGVQKYAFQYAIDNSFEYAIMLHGDGQYTPEVLPDFIEKFQDERKPIVIKHAQEMFSVITENRYPELHSPIEDKKSIIVSEKLGLRKSPQELSVGTREQLYLSLRFGLIKEYGNSSESLPVIVDEILINFDPERAARTATAFGKLSETNQVLVFTCHPWMVDVFRSVKQGAQIVEI